jgi:pSer/pThr/pTyr-binding forkhead associated (FHA) protein
MREGVIIENIDLSKKEFYLVGRQGDICDITLDNPTISRKHAVVQHKDNGDIFLYDMGSTHGTFINKKIIPHKEYIKLKLGDMIRFGQSTRIFILEGPEELYQDNEEEENRQKINIVSKKQN